MGAECWTAMSFVGPLRRTWAIGGREAVGRPPIPVKVLLPRVLKPLPFKPLPMVDENWEQLLGLTWTL